MLSPILVNVVYSTTLAVTAQIETSAYIA